ncbi:PREDICTED: cruciferin PGCRURSE5 [Tarenaya hassleriana]|uniref:cruciferin PGCRURSE5 n=1 Tax=Tarenaya hassleriana TaxID=28532 RepID=UPI00053C539E|nr:PREDICTED: cruciferin PGCRURSE5 [Tarenaya hassleriana]
MANKLVIAVVFAVVAVVVCEARQELGVPPQMRNECELDNLDALEPTDTIPCEAGRIEYWDHTHPQLRCAGVSVVRRVIQPGGLYLPTFHNAPQITYVVQGRGLAGRVIPGCAETYMDSQGLGGEQGQQKFRDMHQKVEHVRHGDVFAWPSGTAHWCYNSGDQPLVTISLIDIANQHNQLDRNPRAFRLAGTNPKGSRGVGGGRGMQQEQNIFSGFDPQILADSYKISLQTAQQLQNQQDNRGNIVHVKGPFQVVRPPLRQEYESEEWRQPRGQNGLEETFCSMRFHESIDDPARADVYKPQLGRVTTVNSYTLPILQYVRLSATRGHINGNAMVLPKWTMNANEILYCTGGQARIQVVNDNGKNVLDKQLQKGQLVVIPQGYAVVMRAQGNKFEWISLKTNDNAMVNTLAGRTSALRALPLEVIMNAYQISQQEAWQIKFNTPETTLTHAGGRQQPQQMMMMEEIVEDLIQA